VVTCLRRGGIFNDDFLANLSLSRRKNVDEKLYSTEGPCDALSVEILSTAAQL